MPAAKTTHSKAGVSVESCRGFIMPASSEPDYIAEDVDATIVSGRKSPRNGVTGQTVSFSPKCCLCATEGLRTLCCPFCANFSCEHACFSRVGYL